MYEALVIGNLVVIAAYENIESEHMIVKPTHPENPQYHCLPEVIHGMARRSPMRYRFGSLQTHQGICSAPDGAA